MTDHAPRIRAVLFDKDGTLIDFEGSWGPTIRGAAALAADGDTALAAHLLEAGGVDPASGRTRPDSLFASGNTREIAARFVEAGSPISIDDLVPALDHLFVQAVDAAVPVCDLGALFGELRRRGLVIGIASSDSETAIRGMLDRFGITRYVAFVAGYDSGYGTKPGPGMVDAFSAAIEVPSGEIAVVGDNLHDMHMAEAGRAGLRIAVLTGTGDPSLLSAHAHHCLPSIVHLTSVIGGEPA